MAAIGALSSAGHATSFQLSAYFVQSDHAWSPGQYAAMAFLGGLVGIVGSPVAGRLADRSGRRVVGFALLGSYPFCVLAFYHGPGWILPVVWIPMIFALMGGNTIARAIAAELFPTASRGMASGLLQISEALGRAAGFFAIQLVTPAGGSNVPAVSLVVFATGIAGLVVLLLPETSQRELEDITDTST